LLKKQGAEKPVDNEPKTPRPENSIEFIIEQEEQQWQDLIDSIEATDVPLEMLKYLRVHLRNGKKMIFPIVKWQDDGVNLDEIKNLVSEWYNQNNREITGSDFIVNLNKLKQTVKLQTERTLKDL
jgi:hypothetical protein